MSEKSILAYFKTREEADAAAIKLRSMRTQHVSISEFGRYPENSNVEFGFLSGGETSSLASLTLSASVSSNENGILLAAHPSASGLSSGGEHPVSGHNYVLAAVVEDDIHHQALSVVEQSGGYL